MCFTKSALRKRSESRWCFWRKMEHRPRSTLHIFAILAMIETILKL